MACNIIGGHLQGSSGLVTMIQRWGILCRTHCRINNFTSSLLNAYTYQANWTCGSSCLTPEEQNLQCSECEAGLQLSLQQLSNEKVSNSKLRFHRSSGQVLGEIFNQFEVSGFCDSTDNTDLCSSFLLIATTQGLPLLAEGMIPDTWLQDRVCNQAVPGTC